MSSKTPQNKKSNSARRENPFETIANVGTSSVKQTVNEFTDMAGGMMDQFMGYGDYDDYEDLHGHEAHPKSSKEDAKKLKEKAKKPVFRFHEHNESVNVKNEIHEIQMLIAQVKEEVKMIKQSNASLMSEVQDVEKLTLSSATEKPKTYDVSFLEVILSLLRTLRLKIGESNNWLQAMVTKRKKRGSLFAARTKSMGTQYSLSQELQVTRNVQ